MNEKKQRAPKSRLSAEKRERFLEVLGQTGNRRLAAEAIGVEPRLMDQRREFDPFFDRQWRAAMDQSQRRLAGASGPLDCIGGAEPMVIRRGPGGRLRVVKAGARHWSRPIEERFFASLAATGNVAAAARSVGFSESSVWQRRRQWPGFARRMEEALEDAEIALEFQLTADASGLSEGFEPAIRQGPAEANDSGEAQPARRFDPEAAMRFLRWRAEKRRGEAQRGRRAKLPTIEEVTEKIVRRVAAIKRHREANRIADEGGENKEGMSPPGAVRAEPEE